MPPHESFQVRFQQQLKEQVGLCHTEADFFRAYSILEMEFIVAESELEDRIAQGFIHYKDMPIPVPIINGLSFHPEGSPNAHQRQAITGQSLWHVDDLVNIYGTASVWIGPSYIKYPYSTLLEAEHRGIWLNERYKFK